MAHGNSRSDNKCWCREWGWAVQHSSMRCLPACYFFNMKTTMCALAEEEISSVYLTRHETDIFLSADVVICRVYLSLCFCLSCCCCLHAMNASQDLLPAQIQTYVHLPKGSSLLLSVSFLLSVTGTDNETTYVCISNRALGRAQRANININLSFYYFSLLVLDIDTHSLVCWQEWHAWRADKQREWQAWTSSLCAEHS